MLRVMAGTKLLRAPADRPAGQRGWRAPVAAVLALAAWPFVRMTSLSGGPERAVYLAVVLALVAAATVTWTARRASLLALAGIAIAGSAIAVALTGFPNQISGIGATRGMEMEYRYDPDESPITRARARAVPKGATKDELEEMLGSAAGEATLRRRDGTDSHCLVYPDQADREYGWVIAFCLEGERYASLHRW
jgi:hypothetical protein